VRIAGGLERWIKVSTNGLATLEELSPNSAGGQPRK
jgi:hypothetical protein